MPRFALLASLALVACSGDPAPMPQPDAAADAAPDVASLPDAPQDAAPPPDLTPPADVAGPDTPPPPDVGPDNGPDVTMDAGPDVAPDAAPDAVEVVDVDPRVTSGDAPTLDGPSSVTQRLDHVEIWQSIDGAPFVSVSGMCNDMRGRVSIRTSEVRVTYVYSPPDAGSTNAIRCTNGMDWGDNRAVYEYSEAYYNPPTGPERVARSNARFTGNIPPRVCDGENPARRVDVFAFGCPILM